MTDDLTALAGEWNTLNERIGAALTAAGDDPAAPVARLLDARALLWGRIGEHVERSGLLPEPVARVIAAGCHYAGLLDQTDAAERRYAAGVPTLTPGTQLALLGLLRRRCAQCGRSWQLDSSGACEACPRLRFGATTADAVDVNLDAADVDTTLHTLREMGLLDD